MKKLIVVLAGIVALVVGIVISLRVQRNQGDAAAAEREEPAPSRAETLSRLAALSGGTAHNTVRLSADLLTPKTEEPQPSKGREMLYERLLAMHPRDVAKEGEILSRMMEAFGDKVDASVGEIACSAEFCRVELRALGKFDLFKRYGRLAHNAFQPRGFKFLVPGVDDAGNTTINFYFGRDDTWSPPDFYALGMI